MCVCVYSCRIHLLFLSVIRRREEEVRRDKEGGGGGVSDFFSLSQCMMFSRLCGCARAMHCILESIFPARAVLFLAWAPFLFRGFSFFFLSLLTIYEMDHGDGFLLATPAGGRSGSSISRSFTTFSHCYTLSFSSSKRNRKKND